MALLVQHGTSCFVRERRPLHIVFLYVPRSLVDLYSLSLLVLMWYGASRTK